MSAVAIVMVAVAIGLLIIYGADVAASMSGDGFLPFDERARGMGLGIPSLVLPFAAYVVGRKSASPVLGYMIVVAGALVLVGGAAILSNPDPARDPAAAAGPLLAAGAAQMVLGAFAARRASRR